ncbi:MAG: exosome complex RNA-binding protein Rrp4 [Thermoplasmata archaeon]|jgi:exosome complex component RRP4|nr:S1 RNA-binding domain-containing protein [Thermoplasmata archaeon]MVT13530.1 S1 RNA-binding domain-containing protein [Euryarchaeota archaeon]MVT14235.1 S1 RNA-binding domain-containing protein [Euryarchaeota archaeon]MVT35916.1 S1 RNA-binding domain-containing protein [Euryarchaeota archaeon]
MEKIREIVLPGEEIDLMGNKPGNGIYIENGKAYVEYLGVKTVKSGYLNIIPLSGRYQPQKGDKVIGKVVDIMPSNWVVDINAPYLAPLHVNDTPWKVDFGDTGKYLNVGDTIIAKIMSVNEVKQVWLTMKEPGLRKLEGGHVITVSPTKVPRIIGKDGSMIKILKDMTNSKIYVGQNGIIWIDGSIDSILKVVGAIRLIEREAHIIGLTDRVKDFLSKNKKENDENGRN